MNSFSYISAANIGEVYNGTSAGGTSLLAGGTTLIDLWKLGAIPINHTIEINSLPLKGIDAKPGSLKMGALERMSDVGSHSDVMKNFPVISQALLLSASPQIRNMASMGGNLMQRPRSISYRNPDPNRRDGPSRYDAIFGVTPVSRAVHPSDLAVALSCLNGTVVLDSKSGQRKLAIADFYKKPEKDLNLWNIRPDEVITSLEVTGTPFAQRSAYVKIRDRASYQFAITSAAVALNLQQGKILEARIAAGGVATIPWRFPTVEQALQNQPPSDEAFTVALASTGNGAETHTENAYKVELLRMTILRALRQAREIA
jgi:xanthine dehydrogenase YagS FAD-binding subunit